jgi:hypothetical protein
VDSMFENLASTDDWRWRQTPQGEWPYHMFDRYKQELNSSTQVLCWPHTKFHATPFSCFEGKTLGRTDIMHGLSIGVHFVFSKG